MLIWQCFNKKQKDIISNPIDNIIHNNYRPDRLSNRTNWLVAPFFRILKGCVAWKSAFLKRLHLVSSSANPRGGNPICFFNMLVIFTFPETSGIKVNIMRHFPEFPWLNTTFGNDNAVCHYCVVSLSINYPCITPVTPVIYTLCK